MPSQDGPFVREEGQLSYSDRAGFGWDGRMIVCGLAEPTGTLLVAAALVTVGATLASRELWSPTGRR